MTRLKILPTLFSMALLGGVVLLPAKADTWDKKTVFTFNAPVEIPGEVLTPGTYVFKLLESPADRHIVQIFNKDETQLIGTVLAIPDYRMKPADKPLITFEERASGAPQAIKAWYYPGDNYGQRFVYPHTRAVELAKRTNDNVPSMSNDMAKNMATQSTSKTDTSVQEMEHTDVTAVKPSGEEVELALIILPAPDDSSSAAAASNTSTTASTAPKQLPKTAGDLPLIALIGACSLGFGALTSWFRRRA